MKPVIQSFFRTALMLMSLLVLSLCQQSMAAPVACSYTIQGAPSNTINAPATTLSIKVTANEATCQWTAISNVSWLKVTSGSNYTGTAFVTVSVEANTTTAERKGTLTIAGQVIGVEQRAACPQQIIGDKTQYIARQGGEVKLKIFGTSCPWSVEPDRPWITVNGPKVGTSDKEVVFTVMANPGAGRTARVNVALADRNVEYIFHQEGVPGSCTYSVSPTSQSVLGAGGNFSFTVGAHVTCTVTATSDSAWVKVTNIETVSISGLKKVSYTVSPNSGRPRSANLNISGQQIPILQDAFQPAPTLTVVNPGFVVAGSPALTFTLTGTNFTSNSRVRLLPLTDLPTTFVSATQLKVSLEEGYLKLAGTRKFIVTDSGATQPSNEQPFLVLSPQASVSAASYKGEDIAPDSIVAAFGVKLADATVVAKTVPLPTMLAGTTVRVIDSKNLERLAPLFFVSAGQVNYLMPADTAPGQATVVITSESGQLSLGYVNIAKVAPGVFTVAANGAGYPSALILRVKANNTQVYESIARYDQATQKFVAVPIDLLVPGEQVFLVLYGTGMRNHGGLNTVNLTIGGTALTTAYAGPSSLTGLDQLNALLPATLAGRGEIDLVLSVGGKQANTVKLTFK